MIQHRRPIAPRRARLRVESLEGRALLAGGFTEFPLPAPPANQFVQVHDIVVRGDDRVEVATSRNGPADPTTGQPTYEGTSIVQATTAGAISLIHPEGDRTRSAIFGLVQGADGNLWGIVNFAPARLNGDGSITRFPLPAGSYAQAITPGPDGALYFTEPYHGLVPNAPPDSIRGAIGRITTTGQISESVLPTNAAKPDQIVAGPDRAIWFTLNDFGVGAAAPAIGRITNLGVVTQYPLPIAATIPHAITAGPDGNLWFTAQGVGKESNLTINTGLNYVGKITTAGTISMFPMNPQAENQKAGGVLGGITAGPDGNVWFTEPKSGHIARISPAGTVTEFPVPTIDSAPNDIVLGRDGALWFTQQLGNKVGRYLPGPDLSATIASPVATAGAGFSGVVASLTDNTPSIASAYQATIDWGDGTAPSAGAFVSNGGRFDIVGGHVYARVGTFVVSVTARQPSGESVTVAGTTVVRAGGAVSGRFDQPTRRSPLRLALSYVGSVDPAVAGNLSRYSAVSLGRVNRRGVQATLPVRLKSASFDAATNTVYLTVRGAVSRRLAVRVTIAGEGTMTIPAG